MKDSVTAFVNTLLVAARMFAAGRLPEKTQFVSLNPFVVLAEPITSSLPAVLP
jgi:hypothetical protein